MKKIFGYGLAILAGLFILIQLIPYGRQHTNPVVVSDYPWKSAEAREVAKRACYDCHSNETTWPWYSNIAPISWRLQRHVDEGREVLNFSDWNSVRRGRRGEENPAEEIGEVVLEGEMPPWDYLITHPSARLSEAEKRTLINGLNPSLASK